MNLTKKHGFYLLFNIQTNTISRHRSIQQIADITNISAYHLKKYHSQYIVNNTWIFTNRKSINIDKCKKINITKRKSKYTADVLDQFYIEQDNIRTVEDAFFGFDSIVGISKKPKHIYKLNAQEARQNGLQQIFTDSILYIDPTKHIYIKNDDYYYQLTMADRKYRGQF